MKVSVAIIGGGPAGLAAAHQILQKGLPFVLLERGPTLEDRNHNDNEHLGNGIGGAGLYSDGKFSFFPSATALWQLPDQNTLQDAYSFLNSLLQPFKFPTPPFEPGILRPKEPSSLGIEKTYPSFYLDPAARTQIIKNLYTQIAKFSTPSAQIHSISGTPDGFWIHLSEPNVEISTETIIFAGGRFGPFELLQQLPQLPRKFRRIEVGVRIEQPSDTFFLRNSAQLDPKILLNHSPGISFRTFCCCRNGEVVTLRNGPIKAVSGRSDGAPSRLSNVGFNLRITDETIGTSIWAPTYQSLLKAAVHTPINERWAHFLSAAAEPELNQKTLGDAFGSIAHKLLREGLTQLSKHYAIDADSTSLCGPTIEAVGYYPEIDKTLRATPYPLWVAGDSTGIFRGLTAALISGFYASKQVVRHLTKD